MFKSLISKGLLSKSEVLILILILWESKIVYIDWRIGGLSGHVDEDFEQFDDDFLQITGSCTLSSSDHYILSKIFVDIDFRKLWLNWRIFIIGGRIWWLNCVVAFVKEDDNLILVRINIMFLLVGLLSTPILVLYI